MLGRRGGDQGRVDAATEVQSHWDVGKQVRDDRFLDCIVVGLAVFIDAITKWGRPEMILNAPVNMAPTAFRADRHEMPPGQMLDALDVGRNRRSHQKSRLFQCVPVNVSRTVRMHHQSLQF